MLGDRTAAALRGVLHQDGLDAYAYQRHQVDARVSPVTDILRRNQGRDDRRHVVSVEPEQLGGVEREEFVVLYVGAVLHEERAQHLAVRRENLGGQVALGVLQLLERRQPPEQAGGREQQQEQQECERGEYDAPEPFDGFGQRFMWGLFFHRFNSICRKDSER